MKRLPANGSLYSMDLTAKLLSNSNAGIIRYLLVQITGPSLPKPRAARHSQHVYKSPASCEYRYVPGSVGPSQDGPAAPQVTRHSYAVGHGSAYAAVRHASAVHRAS